MSTSNMSKFQSGRRQNYRQLPFLADRTIGRAYGTVCRLSVCLSVVCDVLYCGKTVRPSQKVSEGANRKPGSELIFWVAAIFLLPVSPIWPLRRPFLPYGRPNLALAGLLVYVRRRDVYTGDGYEEPLSAL